MDAARLARIIVSNLVIVVLIWAVFQDQAGRLTYFRELGFTASTAYYPFFYATSAVSGTTFINGQLTLDWVQVLAAALAVLDLGFIWPYLRRSPGQKVSETVGVLPPKSL